jgi:phage tail sheath protein FI
MPEYLAPGVYVEEVSFRSKSIEGVSTSVAGFIGPTRYGPTEGSPELLTSFSDFERIYGGVDSLDFGNTQQVNYMAHAVRAFFDNGGSKLYVTRVYQPNNDTDGKASLDLPTASPPDSITIKLRARFPGHTGEMRILFAVRTSPNLLTVKQINGKEEVGVIGIREHDVVFIKNGTPASPPNVGGLYDVTRGNDDQLIFNGVTGTPRVITAVDQVYRITLNVRVRLPGRFADEQAWADLTPHPKSRNAITSLFTDEPSSRQQYLTVPFAIVDSDKVTSGAQLVESLFGQVIVTNLSSSKPLPEQLEKSYILVGGSDGKLPIAETYNGEEDDHNKTGLKTFEDIDQISIIAAPGHSHNYNVSTKGNIDQIVQHLITHCENMRYRVAVLDSPNNQVLSEVQEFRGKLDSKYAALYYPWIKIMDPMDPDGRNEIFVPPSGFVAGIYARTDMLHGVFKAPANEITLGGIGFELLLNKAQQDILNPLGINCFRFFENRGFRLWGARTISSDPEWKYISVRRYFAYLEHSVDKGTQWAVFENNNEPLWANVRTTIADFLVNEWRNGALMGSKPEEAFFVRCDRSTITQNDLDNGRLICLIGVAVVKPAEFVIFRIGQFTADRKS